MESSKRLLILLTVGLLLGPCYDALAGDAGGGEGCVLEGPPTQAVQRIGAVGLEITRFTATEGNVDITMRVNQGGRLFWIRDHFESVILESPDVTGCALRDLVQHKVLVQLGFDPAKKQLCLTHHSIQESQPAREIVANGVHTLRYTALADLTLYIADVHAKC